MGKISMTAAKHAGRISMTAAISLACLILATTFASAGWIDYFTGKLTGHAVTNSNLYDVDDNGVFNNYDLNAVRTCNAMKTDFNGDLNKCDEADITKINSIIKRYDLNRDGSVNALDINVMKRCNNQELDFRGDGNQCESKDLAMVKECVSIKKCNLKYDLDGTGKINNFDRNAMERCVAKDFDFNANGKQCDKDDITKIGSIIKTYDVNKDESVNGLDVIFMKKCKNKEIDFNKNNNVCDDDDLQIISCAFDKKSCKPVCTPNWKCTSWLPCQPNNQQTRTCTDARKCNSASGKPIESQACIYTQPASDRGLILVNKNSNLGNRAVKLAKDKGWDILEIDNSISKSTVYFDVFEGDSYTLPNELTLKFYESNEGCVVVEFIQNYIYKEQSLLPTVASSSIPTSGSIPICTGKEIISLDGLARLKLLSVSDDQNGKKKLSMKAQYISTDALAYGSFVKNIKDAIRNKYGSGNFKYLLIVGTDFDIPLEDRTGIIKSTAFKDITSSVLDSLFYGDIDDDGWVELGVGRLPFDDPVQIDNYYKNQNYFNNPKVSLNYYETFEGLGVLPGERANGICLAQQNIMPSKEAFLRNYSNSDIFFVSTHGNFRTLSITDPSGIGPDDISALNVPRRPVIVLGACLAARELGIVMVKSGAGALFAQFYSTGVFGAQRSLIISDILEGKSYGESMMDYLNYARAHNAVVGMNSAAPFVLSNIDKNVFSDNTIVLYGDPSIKRVKNSYFKQNKPVLSSNNGIYTLTLPRPKQINYFSNEEHSAFCYDGSNVINVEPIPGFAVQNIQNNMGEWGRMTVLAFPMDSEKKTISDLSKTVGGKKVEIIPPGQPVLSILNGKGKSYLVIINAVDDKDVLSQSTTFTFRTT